MATADALELRREPALGRAALLAAAMHVVLIALVFIGVKWQSYDPDTVTVELWEPQPVPQETVEPPKPAPPPPPKVEAPKPEPKVEKPDITLRDKAKPKPKPKAEPKPKPDLEFERQIREQAAMEQRAMQEQQKLLEDQRRAAEAARRERELQALLARQAADAKAKAQSEWVRKIQAKIRPNVYLPPDLKGNPEAVYLVTLLPDGSVLSVRKRRSSGHPGYDTAVERAIEKSSPLPKPDDPSVFTRELELKFRPLDEE
jgi:colicin import membrane protein